MADHIVPHFHNDPGMMEVRIGVKEFMCIGAQPPFDHPHVFLDMGTDHEKICPYCGTHYKYDATLHGNESIPAGLAWQNSAGAESKAAA